MRHNEARSAWQSDKAMLEEAGLVVPGIHSYVADEYKYNYELAMDAIPAALLANTNGIPAFLTTMIDPDVVRIVFSPTKAAEIFGERRKGTWLDDTTIFTVVEHTGEVSSYGDFNNNGRAGVNTNFPQRQSYLYQTIVEYGDRELERAGLARINYAAELDTAAATVMNRFANDAYFFGLAGLQNYGALNDPGLSAALTPSTKAATGTKWVNAGAVVATANEVYADIQALFLKIVSQSMGTIDQNTPMVLITSPDAAVALTATNSFNVSVTDLLKKNFPNIRIETAPQYGAQSATNPRGSASGTTVQLIATRVDGQETAYVAFNEKMRNHPPVRDVSSTKKKLTGGVWGAVIRYPIAIAQMVGV